jgi:hypothetical protein
MLARTSLPPPDCGLSWLAKSHIKAIPDGAEGGAVARAKTKTEVATIKLTPECRSAWEAAATRERRSLANMFEVALLEYCSRHGVAVPVIQTPRAPPPRRKLATKKAAAK